VIRALLVADADITTYGVRQILDKDSEIALIGVASSLEEGRTVVESETTQVVVINTQRSKFPKPEALKNFVIELKRVSKRTGVLVLTDCSDRQTFDFNRNLGIEGFCLKTISEDDLVSAIKTVARGEIYIHDDYAEGMAGDNDLPLDNLDDLLGERQMEILDLILRGYTNQEISEQLYISLPTVKSHVRVILRKLNARDRVHMIAKILQGVLKKDAGRALQ